MIGLHILLLSPLECSYLFCSVWVLSDNLENIYFKGKYIVTPTYSVVMAM